ncbi:calcium-activated chloride channel regulator 1-like [Amblyomma americanum]
MSGMFMFTAVLLLFLSTGASVQLDTSDGGYTELRVSISNSVTPDESIIGNIKALFRSSTEFLHKATNGRVYFKHVIIEVPKTWPKRNSSWAPSSNASEKSDVLIDMPTPPYDDRPFTTQVKPCGEPGEFIHLTPGFLATLTNSTAKRFINPAYVFVHEWAHFRYGVFDDYGSLNDSRYPLTFCYNNTVRLNACSSRIVFSPRTAEGRLCSINKKCRLHRNCKVIIKQLEHDPVQSSIMFMPYVANVSQFSDSRKGPCPHIPYAPNKQNEYCDQRSTWDVISKHEDFKNLPMPDMSKPIEVTFDEAQEDEDLPQRVALELNVSRSTRLLDADEEFTSSLESKHQVDSAVGNSTVVHVKQNSPGNMRIQASLNEPSGQPCQGCHESANADKTTVTIPSPAMVGNRTLHMTSVTSTPAKVSVRVESEPRAKDYEPILVTCQMVYLIVEKFDKAVVSAKVTKGKKPVLDAVVLARVYRPEKDPQPIKFPLHDDAEGKSPSLVW